MIIVGIVIEVAFPYIKNIIGDLGLSKLPIALIVLGVVLEILFVLNCIAICSGDNKCALLKKILGVTYSLMGLIMIIVAWTEGGNIKELAAHAVNPTSADTQKQCGVFQD